MVRDLPGGSEEFIAPFSNEEGIFGSNTFVALASLKKNNDIC